MKALFIFIILIIGITVFYSCKKDKDNSIIGVWEGHVLKENSQVYAGTYVFNGDSTFTETRTIKDTLNGKTLGYQYLCTGRFSVVKDKLVLTASSTKINGNGYGDISQLTEVTFATINIIRHTFVFNAGGNMFYFPSPPCGPAENCIATLYYYRQ